VVVDLLTRPGITLADEGCWHVVRMPFTRI